MMLPIDLNLLNQTPAKYMRAKPSVAKPKPTFIHILKTHIVRVLANAARKIHIRAKAV